MRVLHRRQKDKRQVGISFINSIEAGTVCLPQLVAIPKNSNTALPQVDPDS
jgi:hypothetical protein